MCPHNLLGDEPPAAKKESHVGGRHSLAPPPPNPPTRPAIHTQASSRCQAWPSLHVHARVMCVAHTRQSPSLASGAPQYAAKRPSLLDLVCLGGGLEGGNPGQAPPRHEGVHLVCALHHGSVGGCWLGRMVSLLPGWLTGHACRPGGF